jgi:hypothetical protein
MLSIEAEVSRGPTVDGSGHSLGRESSPGDDQDVGTERVRGRRKFPLRSAHRFFGRGWSANRLISRVVPAWPLVLARITTGRETILSGVEYFRIGGGALGHICGLRPVSRFGC